MTDEDLALLQEYEEWRQAVPTTPDTSIEAFRRQKEAAEDRARIVEATETLAIAIHNWEQRDDRDHVAPFLQTVFDTLTGDRPQIDVSTLTDPTPRRISA